MSKGIIVFSLLLLLASTFLAADSKELSYENINGSFIPGCSDKHPEGCKPANEYNRGCSGLTRCRRGS